ncbi:MAG TPA: glycine cleavage system aminomethyltransferase GcvT [Elusimicrobiota bacterium]|nr:glycine cleavage system aminomethyltransferase GcvT [Elusimicrobiota bacterium]
MNRTPLYPLQKQLGARFMDFGGWELPLQFKGILAEHKAVREKSGLFDISHMGQVWAEGPGAESFLNGLLTNDIAALPPQKGLYSVMCRENGGVIDDLYVYRLTTDRFLLIVNASRKTADLDWIRRHRPGGVNISEQPEAAAVALQGPDSPDLLNLLCAPALALGRNGVGAFTIEGSGCVIGRTGYTGEDGFEIFASAENLRRIFQKIWELGEPRGLNLCGLGARDTLRLEMGYRLYGQDLDEDHSPLEAGLGWTVRLEKKEFIGRDALREEKERGPKRRFIAFRPTEPGVPRHGGKLSAGNQIAGEVTSGTFSPSLQAGIGMGYVESRFAAAPLAVEIHHRDVPVSIVKLPFYHK